MENREWLERRRAGIGGSDIGAITGLNPWRKPIDVWLDKTGRLEEEGEVPLRLRLGKEMEPIVRQLYTEKTGLAVEEIPMIASQDGPYVANLDGMAHDRVVELKTADPMQRHLYNGAAPGYYAVQCQWYMMLTGKQLADLAVLFGLREFEVYTLKADPALQESLRVAADQFWKYHVVPDVQPALESGESTRQWLLKKHRIHTDEIRVATSEEGDLAQMYIELDKSMKRDAGELDLVKAEMMDAIGSAAGIQGIGWKATWKHVKDQEITNWKAVALELAKGRHRMFDRAVGAHTTTRKGTRRFLFHTREEA